MSASLARYLKDFSAPPPLMVEEDFDLASDDFPVHIEPAEPPVDLEEERRLAFEEGRAAMRAELEAEHARQIDAINQARLSAEAEIVERYETEMAASIALAARRIRQSLTEQFSAELFEALTPIVDEQITGMAVDALASAVKSAFQDDDGIELVLRGPASLAQRLSPLLQDEGFRMRHVEAAGVDLAVEHGDTLFATRLAAWRSSVEELLK